MLVSRVHFGAMDVETRWKRSRDAKGEGRLSSELDVAITYLCLHMYICVHACVASEERLSLMCGIIKSRKYLGLCSILEWEK